MIQEKVINEYNRLLHLFKDVDENKTKLVDELLMKAAFLKVQLDELEVSLKKQGAIQISNKGNARESINYKTYLKTLTVYQGIIKTLSIVMGRNTIDDDDEFDEFLRTANL
jgi:predicted methyltransferase